MRNENGSRADGRCSALARRRPMWSSGDGERVDGRLAALTRRCVGAPLYDSELCAGAMLRLAGCSSGRGVGARGGRRRGVGGKTPPASLSHLPFQERQSVRLTGREPPMKGEVSPQATEGLSPCRGVYVARKKHSAA